MSVLVTVGGVTGYTLCADEGVGVRLIFLCRGVTLRECVGDVLSEDGVECDDVGADGEESALNNDFGCVGVR